MATTAPPSTPPTLADPGDHAADRAAIEALITDVAAGVTARDPDRCVARFAADARSVTGRWIAGRDAIHAAHVAAFGDGSVPVRARFEVLDVLFVRPDVAIATAGAFRAGPDEPVDLAAPPTIATWTLVRTDDGWWVAARQLTPVAS